MTTRLALALALGAALGTASAALADGGAGPMERGSAVYAEQCAGCHATAARIVRRVPGDTDAARGEWLEGFLPGHHSPDDELRAALIAYLLSL